MCNTVKDKNSARNYQGGSDELFFKYLDKVKCKEIKEVVFYARKFLKQNLEFTNIGVYNRLEKFIESYFCGEIKINDDDSLDWEMLGRPYESLFRYFMNSTDKKIKDIRDTCWERAMISYIKAYQGNRALMLFEMCPADSQELKSNFESIVKYLSNKQ